MVTDGERAAQRRRLDPQPQVPQRADIIHAQAHCCPGRSPTIVDLATWMAAASQLGSATTRLLPAPRATPATSSPPARTAVRGNSKDTQPRHPRVGGGPAFALQAVDIASKSWIPACAGMTSVHSHALPAEGESFLLLIRLKAADHAAGLAMGRYFPAQQCAHSGIQLFVAISGSSTAGAGPPPTRGDEVSRVWTCPGQQCEKAGTESASLYSRHRCAGGAALRHVQAARRTSSGATLAGAVCPSAATRPFAAQVDRSRRVCARMARLRWIDCSVA